MLCQSAAQQSAALAIQICDLHRSRTPRKHIAPDRQRANGSCFASGAGSSAGSGQKRRKQGTKLLLTDCEPVGVCVLCLRKKRLARLICSPLGCSRTFRPGSLRCECWLLIRLSHLFPAKLRCTSVRWVGCPRIALPLHRVSPLYYVDLQPTQRPATPLQCCRDQSGPPIWKRQSPDADTRVVGETQPKTLVLDPAC